MSGEIIGKRVKAEDGQEGTVVAVAHVGGGAGTGRAWQFLIRKENDTLIAVDAINAKVVRPEGFIA